MQALEVAGRVGETVGVVDAQAVDHAFADQVEHLAVRQLEDLGILDAHAGEIVDVEEAPVVAGLGIDVEDARALGFVGPPAVLVACAHVVGDDVEDDRQPGVRQLAQPLLAAERLRDARRVDDVVAVRRARARGERRRQVQVADAEVAQVGHERAHVVEAQVRAQLQAVGGAELGHVQSTTRSPGWCA